MPSCDRLLTCSHCGSVLLSADHRGGTVACMDRALVHHTSASCRPGNRVEATLRALGPLLQAITHGEATVAEVTRLVQWPDDEPPLVFCARHWQLRSVALAMLESGLAAETASLDATSKDGLTALHLAALQDDVALLAALCEAGADASMQSQDNAAAQLPGGRTALHCVRSAEAARHLIASCPAALLTPDWQGSLPAQVAQLHGAERLAAHLARAALEHVAETEVASGEGGGGGDASLDEDDRADLERLQRGGGDAAPAQPHTERATHEALLRVDIKERRRLRLRRGRAPLEPLCASAPPLGRVAHPHRVAPRAASTGGLCCARCTCCVACSAATSARRCGDRWRARRRTTAGRRRATPTLPPPTLPYGARPRRPRGHARASRRASSPR